MALFQEIRFSVEEVDAIRQFIGSTTGQRLLLHLLHMEPSPTSIDGANDLRASNRCQGWRDCLVALGQPEKLPLYVAPEAAAPEDLP